MNKVIISGRITNAIELRRTKDDVGITNLIVAVRRDFKNAQGDYDTDFVKVVVYGQQADYLNKFTEKGKRIEVDGRIQVQQYEKDGEKRYDTSIVANKVNILDFKEKEEDPFEEFGKKVEADSKREMPF